MMNVCGVLIVLAFFSLIQAEPLSFHRDPFQLSLSEDLSAYVEASNPQSLDIQLNGIIWDDYLPMAVVSVQGLQKTLLVGDFFLGYECVAILPNSIELKNRADQLSLKLGLPHSQSDSQKP